MLKNYTTYATYYRLTKAADDDPVVNRHERNENFATIFLIKEELREIATDLMMEEVFVRLQAREPAVPDG